MRFFNNILETIGKTPIIKIQGLNDTHAEIYVKLESLNPGGSIKDRVAARIIEEAEKEGTLKPGTTIIEATSGNTGVGLAMVAAVKGYKLIIVMPSNASVERLKLIQAYGAEVVLIDPNLGMKGCLEKIDEITKTLPNFFIPDQFRNPNNPKAHFDTTGVEIWEDLRDSLDIFICGTGTGGSFSGTSRFLKEKNPKLYTIALEPERSPFISKGISGPHEIQGMGMSAGFIPSTFHPDVMDEIKTVSHEDSLKYVKLLAKHEGILGGISSGANLAAAMDVARRPENKGKKILTIVIDTGERYLSNNIF